MFAYLYHTLFAKLLQSNDDFFTRCRKAVITICFVFGIVNFANNTFSTVSSKDVDTCKNSELSNDLRSFRDLDRIVDIREAHLYEP